MGVYDTIGKEYIQVKLWESCLDHFDIGDELPDPIDDGVYIGYEGWFVVKDNKILATGLDVYTKYGGLLDKKDIIDPSNPIAQYLHLIKMKR